LFLIVVAAVAGMTLAVVNEYERAVVFRLGRVLGARGPGLCVIVRGLDQVRRVSMQVVPLEIPAREVITRDNVPVRVQTVVYARVVDPVKAVVDVDNYRTATSQVTQAAVRAHVGAITLDRLLHEQASVNAELTALVAERTAAWGVEVGQAEIKDVELRDDRRPAPPSPAAAPAAPAAAPRPAAPEQSWADPATPVLAGDDPVTGDDPAPGDYV
jgi:regulator of protease activity HflC (stomatin/prohibitin superfamily)